MITCVRLKLSPVTTWVRVTTWVGTRRLIIKVISFGGHESQTIERIKALYDMYKCILIISGKRDLKLYKKIFRIFVNSLVFCL